MPSCPHCNDDIGELSAFALEENKYTVELVEYVEGSPRLDWGGISEVMESTVVKTDYECPNCGDTLFTVVGGESDPQVIIDFLRGVKMTWVQDGERATVAEVLGQFNARPKPEGSYYAEGFSRAGGEVGIYFVDPTAPRTGMAPVESSNSPSGNEQRKRK